MFWFILFGVGFFFAYKARQTTNFVKEDPTGPLAGKFILSIGLYYLSATLTLSLFPLMMKDYTDNIIPSLVVFIPAALIGIAAYVEYHGDVVLANTWVQRAFYSIAAGIMIMSFLVPAEDYKMPHQPAQQESQEYQYDGKTIPLENIQPPFGKNPSLRNK